ncbi:MAG TPA: diguanylate cyclase, partial [Longimicrobiales bacterium]|nr:diguanylate cyclase [Longimicrobiales bacterium]
MVSPNRPTRQDLRSSRVPVRAAILSIAAFAVPVVGTFWVPEALAEYEALLWLTALIPAFLLSYYRGWQGAATAFAFGMAVLAIVAAVLSALDRPVPNLLPGIVVVYIVMSIAIGWLAEILHRDRDEVEDLAFTDALTRLPNRRHVDVFLANEFAAARRGRFLSVVIFDLDHFKLYNDTYGHEAGDAALARFGEVLIRTTRRMNLSARLGGEEFVSILAGSDAHGATVFAERVRDELVALNLGDGPLTVSAGVAQYHAGYAEPRELLAAADEALYDAKNEGRNRIVTKYPEGAEDPESAEHVRAREERTPLPPIGEGRSVLVVEEDAQVRTLLSNYLDLAGFSVVKAGDGASGIRSLAAEHAVVIMDMRLSDMEPRELIRAVKSRHPTTQIVVLTAVHDADTTADALQAGADRYLVKPFGMPELRAHLIDALEYREHLKRQEKRKRELSADGLKRDELAREAVLAGARALVRAVEARDPYTAGSAWRVAGYAEVLADQLDPDGALLPRESLRLGCELHDVGKLGIPDSILNKPGPLDAGELAEMRRHPEIGRAILEPMIDDTLALAVASWHHEHWDGSGYPDGLRGQSIPLAARVAAVAGVLNAITRPRAWRAARTWDDAIEIVRDGSGTQFDPRV